MDEARPCRFKTGADWKNYFEVDCIPGVDSVVPNIANNICLRIFCSHLKYQYACSEITSICIVLFAIPGSPVYAKGFTH